MMIHPKQKQSGISVVEIMVGVAISLILLAGVIETSGEAIQTGKGRAAVSRTPYHCI